MMQLETRICADPKCNAKFKCLPNSPQDGCCRDHDSRGRVNKDKLTMRRKKFDDVIPPLDEEDGSEEILPTSQL